MHMQPSTFAKDNPFLQFIICSLVILVPNLLFAKLSREDLKEYRVTFLSTQIMKSQSRH